MAKRTDRKIDYLQIRMDGSLKNQIIDYCKQIDVSVTAWVTETLRRALREAWGIPEPPPARAPFPTPQEVMRSWRDGEQVVMPCGMLGSCEGVHQDPLSHGGMEFCAVCNIRTA